MEQTCEECNLPVSERFKKAVRRRTEEWMAKILQRYFPTAKLESLDLDNTRIVLERTDTPYVRLAFLTGYPFRTKVWTIEREGHKGEHCLLLLENASAWDAESQDAMLTWRCEYTVLDADGVCFQTTLFYLDEQGHHPPAKGQIAKKAVARVPASDGHTYYMERPLEVYLFRRARGYFSEVLGERVMCVIRDETDNNTERWFLPRERRHRTFFELVDRKKRPVLRLGGVSLKRRVFLALFSARTFGPRRKCPIRHLDKTIPKEVVLFLAMYLGDLITY